MASNVAAVKEKVQRILIDLMGKVEIDRDGDFTFRNGSARVFISVFELSDEFTGVVIFAPTNRGLPPSAELFKFVACETAYRFGSLRAKEADGKVNLTLRYTLLGDFLDPEELKVAISAIAGTADEIDTQIKDRFGGTTFHQDPQP